MSELVIPKHVGFIVDGNRRWAKKHGLPAYEGHLAGYNAVSEIVFATFDSGVKYISAYAFSTENWKRDEDEVKKIMNLALKVFTSDLPIYMKKNIKIKVLGSREKINKRILKAIDVAEERTANNTDGTLAICFNYGGQLEIVDAIKKIIQTGISADEMSVDLISQNLYAPELPPLDLIIRTSGEQRISNFMLWRAAYSEIMFIEKLWPDMRKDDITDAIKIYGKRNRRFGK